MYYWLCPTYLAKINGARRPIGWNAKRLKTPVLEYPTRAYFLYKSNESEFANNQSRLKAIEEKGNISGGSGRKSTTVLLCVSADI